MNRIAEQKAMEAYPFEPIECGGGIADSNSECRGLYQEGYDQAMQDFLEKAERFFKEELFTRFSGIEYRVASNKCINLQQFIEQFKNYMEDEN